MNRQIKFRGKRVDNGEWVEGDLVRTNNGTTISWKGDEGMYTYCYVIPETVGQFTGLHDKNGKEIYEGDHFGNKYFHVTFNYGQFLLGGVPLIGYFNGNYMTQLEAITGNIHDND